MSQEERKGIQVILITYKDFDLQKAYTVGTEVMSKLDGIFNGLNVFTFAGSPPRDKQTITFFVKSDQVGAAVKEIADALKLTQGADFIVQAFPSSQFSPRPPPRISM